MQRLLARVALAAFLLSLAACAHGQVANRGAFASIAGSPAAAE